MIRLKQCVVALWWGHASSPCGKLRKSSSESQAEEDQVPSDAVDGLKSVDVRVVGKFEGGAHSEGARRFSKLMLSRKPSVLLPFDSA